VLKILGEVFGIDVHPQVYNCAVGMHGAGNYGAQCGLVEGALMFLGLRYAKQKGAEETAALCKKLAAEFEEHFGSLLCRELRPEGFKKENPPHLCEPFSVKAIIFHIGFICKLENLGWLD